MHDTFSYRAYGVRLRANRVLPGLVPDSGPEDVTVDFAGLRNGHFAAMPEPLSRIGLETFWRLDDDNWHMRHTDYVNDRELDVRLGDRGSSVTIRWTVGTEVADAVPVLQGHLFGALLHLRGVPLLHASVIAVGDRAIAVMGDAGAGKSTTAAAFVTQGHALMSDDLAAIDVGDDAVRVHSGYSRLRMHADTAHALGMDLPRIFITPNLGDKRYLELDEARFRADTLPLSAIFFLQKRGVTAGIESVPERDALPVLLRNIYSPRYLDPARRGRVFTTLARVAQRVPIHRVRAADSFAALPELVASLARLA